MSHPLVVNLRHKVPYDVYVGRSRSAARGRWGNPFQIGVDGTREEVVARYRNYLLGHPALLRALPELRGKVLGCYCAPAACHADVLAELANGTGDVSGSMSLFGEEEAL